jgi:hypothetical protein
MVDNKRQLRFSVPILAFAPCCKKPFLDWGFSPAPSGADEFCYFYLLIVYLFILFYFFFAR